jgi:serine protease AprX
MRLEYLFVLLLLPLSLPAQVKLARDLRLGHSTGDADVLVRFRQPLTHGELPALRHCGGKERARFHASRLIAATVPASQLVELSNQPGVDYIAPNRTVRASLDTARAATGAQWVAASGFTGAGIGVAVIDSGYGEHPDLPRSTVVYSESFGLASARDEYGHGTAVMGVLASQGATSGGRFRGLAPGVKIVNLRVLDHNGEGSDAAVIAAIERAIQLKAKYNIRVINLSFGRPVAESYTTDPLGAAVEAAWKAGIVVVAAAGNGGRHNALGVMGYGTIQSPGNHPLAITVGALKTLGTPLREDDIIASYSAKGPTAVDHVLKPDLVAPGNWIVSLKGTAPLTLERLFPRNVVPPAHLQLSGSSLAAPMVSAAVALLLEHNPALSPDLLKARLMKTAWKSFPPEVTAVDPLTGAEYRSRHDAFTVGAGALDIHAALNSADMAVGTAASPIAFYDSTTDSVRLRFPYQPAWGGNTVWTAGAIGGPSVVWGNNVVAGSNALWGSNVVWGVSSMRGFALLWASQPSPAPSPAVASSVLGAGER